MSSQKEVNPNYGHNFVNACWALTGIVALALIFRYVVKAWASWVLPRVSSPMRIWGAEDVLYMIGFAFDIAHIAVIQISTDHGLGRHIWFLSDEQRLTAIKYDFISQPLAVTASMFSRCGMTWFLYTCFGSLDRHIRASILVGMAIQVVANSVTVLQIVLQCGPHPYRVVNRAAYFHYMWDPLPADGSVVCQPSNVQTTIGFVQGAFNTLVDFFLTVLSAMQLWQFSIRTIERSSVGPDSFFSRFKRMPRQARNRRLWQTLILSGPLALSGCASIVKTYWWLMLVFFLIQLLKSLGERNDFTHNIMPFFLWVKIENYSILLASCGPIVRLFVRVVFDKNSNNASTGKYGYLYNSRGQQYGGGGGVHAGIELDGSGRGLSQNANQGSVVMSVFAGERKGGGGDGDSGAGAGAGVGVGIGGSRLNGGVRGRGRDDGANAGGGVTIKTDITVQVDEDGASTSGLVRPRFDD
ncbi:hypothetical protein BJX76DRAFT_353350 [Aspergillus varians]